MITITPGIWRQDDGPDPSWRVMTLTVTGAAPGRWTLRNNGPGWYMHLYHNGNHVGMTGWNAWDAVEVCIAHESGPYTVTKTGELGEVHVLGLTLSDARLIAYRAEKQGVTATIANPDGNEVRFPRCPDTGTTDKEPR